MRLPAALVPLLEQVRRANARHGAPLEFWRMEHGPAIFDGFAALADLLMQSELTEDEVPRGYVMLAHLFQWEVNFNVNGWGALDNISEIDFETLCGYFGEVGLAGQARSLGLRMAAYRRNPEDMGALIRAGADVPGDIPGDIERAEYLTQYFCDHADELLYEQEPEDAP